MDIFVLFRKKSVEQHYSSRQLQKKRVRTCISVQIKPVPPGTLRDVHDGALKKKKKKKLWEGTHQLRGD